nr:MAG TPA: hypothetical protein [Caudoviricetes sp.]
MKRLSKLRRQLPTLLNPRRLSTLRKPLRSRRPRPRQKHRQKHRQKALSLPKTGKLTLASGSAEPRQIASRSSL